MGNNKKIMIFFGPPGSGKGTQAEILGKKTGLDVISPGNLFRHEQAENTQLGKMISGYMARGELVPDRITLAVMNKRLKAEAGKGGFILDGFPRNARQLKALKQYLPKTLKKTDKLAAIFIDTGDKTVIERISGRRICDCGASYHIKFDPSKVAGICDDCGQKLHQRKDDAPAIIRNRLENFHKRIKPLLAFFEKNHLLVTVDGNKGIDGVEKEIRHKLNKQIVNMRI